MPLFEHLAYLLLKICAAYVLRASEVNKGVEMERSENQTKEIASDELSPADEIVIRTENSEYHFEVVDPAQRQGVLSGGSVGNQPQEAVLIGPVAEGGKGSAGPAVALKTNARALFFMNAGNGLRRLVTSVVTKLTHLKGRLSARRPGRLGSHSKPTPNAEQR